MGQAREGATPPKSRTERLRRSRNPRRSGVAPSRTWPCAAHGACRTRRVGPDRRCHSLDGRHAGDSSAPHAREGQDPDSAWPGSGYCLPPDVLPSPFPSRARRNRSRSLPPDPCSRSPYRFTSSSLRTRAPIFRAASRAFLGETEASAISAIMTGEPPAVNTLQPVTPLAPDRIVSA